MQEVTKRVYKDIEMIHTYKYQLHEEYMLNSKLVTLPYIHNKGCINR